MSVRYSNLVINTSRWPIWTHHWLVNQSQATDDQSDQCQTQVMTVLHYRDYRTNLSIYNNWWKAHSCLWDTHWDLDYIYYTEGMEPCTPWDQLSNFRRLEKQLIIGNYNGSLTIMPFLLDGQPASIARLGLTPIVSTPRGIPARPFGNTSTRFG